MTTIANMLRDNLTPSRARPSRVGLTLRSWRAGAGGQIGDESAHARPAVCASNVACSRDSYLNREVALRQGLPHRLAVISRSRSRSNRGGGGAVVVDMVSELHARS